MYLLINSSSLNSVRFSRIPFDSVRFSKIPFDSVSDICPIHLGHMASSFFVYLMKLVMIRVLYELIRTMKKHLDRRKQICPFGGTDNPKNWGSGRVFQVQTPSTIANALSLFIDKSFYQGHCQYQCQHYTFYCLRSQ